MHKLLAAALLFTALGLAAAFAEDGLPVFKLAEAGELIGRPLSADAGWRPHSTTFRPFAIAENHVRSATIEIGAQRFPDLYQHALVVDGKAAGVRLFLQGIKTLEHKPLDQQARFIEALSQELLALNPPADDLIMPLRISKSSEVKWKQQQWRYEAANGLSYTLYWVLNAETQVWVETPEFVELRKAEEAREVEGKPLLY